jgi:hypothetical protein
MAPPHRLFAPAATTSTMPCWVSKRSPRAVILCVAASEREAVGFAILVGSAYGPG